MLSYRGAAASSTTTVQEEEATPRQPRYYHSNNTVYSNNQDDSTESVSEQDKVLRLRLRNYYSNSVDESGGDSSKRCQRSKSLNDKKKQVRWSADTVDNEQMRKKKSKRCCIYHKDKAFGESSTESDTSDASTNTDETDYDTDDTRARKKRRERVRRRRERYRRKYLGEQYGAAHSHEDQGTQIQDASHFLTKCQRCGHQHEMPENDDDDSLSSASSSS